ncbi:MAG: ATP synthase F0 subunit B [Pseudomonadota bacterium]
MKMLFGCRKRALTQTSIAGLIVLAVPFEALAAGGMVDVDPSLFIQIINFLFLIWVLNIILYRPIRRILIQRKEKINGLEKGIEAAEANAGAKQEAFAEGIKAARIKGQKQKEIMINEASAEEKEIVDRINESAKNELAAAKSKVAEDISKVREALRSELDTFANAVCEKILGRAV